MTRSYSASEGNSQLLSGMAGSYACSISYGRRNAGCERNAFGGSVVTVSGSSYRGVRKSTR